jgi:hypothetical protein
MMLGVMHVLLVLTSKQWDSRRSKFEGMNQGSDCAESTVMSLSQKQTTYNPLPSCLGLDKSRLFVKVSNVDIAR